MPRISVINMIATNNVSMAARSIGSSTKLKPFTSTLRERLLTPPKYIAGTGATAIVSHPPSNIYLLDGGVSTHLRDLWGRDFPYPELWSSSLLLTKEGMSTILQGHKDWLTSGSDILTTVTYQSQSLSGIVDESQLDSMLRNGVKLARQAIEEETTQESEENNSMDSTRNKRPLFAVASMGCYGAALADGSEYTGNYPCIKNEQDLVDFHRHKTRVLLEQQPDGIALETVPCVRECRAFLSLMRELSPSQASPACWISLACRNGHELNDGSPLEDALEAIHELDPNADLVQAIGINCCDSEHSASLTRIIITFLAQRWCPSEGHDNADNRCRGIVIYPNSGEEWDATTKTWKEGTGLRKDDLQDVFAVGLVKNVEMIHEIWDEYHPNSQPPTILLGGCCRTMPKTIRALRQEVDQRFLKQGSL